MILRTSLAVTVVIFTSIAKAYDSGYELKKLL